METSSIDPITALKSDHEIVRSVLNNLEEYLKKIGKVSSEGLRNNLINQLNEITAFIDKDLEVHFKKEEDGLFPVLGKYIGTETGPIHVMLLEHKQSREISSEFKSKIKDYQSTKEFDSILNDGFAFFKLLSEHIDKEEQILFNMADMQLSKEEKHEIMQKFLNISSISRETQTR